MFIFRILYSVLHLKDSSTSMRAKLDDLNSIHTLVQLNISERLHSSNKKLSFQIAWRVFRHNDAIISNTAAHLLHH